MTAHRPEATTSLPCRAVFCCPAEKTCTEREEKQAKRSQGVARACPECGRKGGGRLDSWEEIGDRLRDGGREDEETTRAGIRAADPGPAASLSVPRRWDKGRRPRSRPTRAPARRARLPPVPPERPDRNRKAADSWQRDDDNSCTPHRRTPRPRRPRSSIVA
jgi:hypothetical protein